MERLPNELLNNIAAEIDCPKDLLALATTSKAWCETRTLCGRRRLVWIFFAEHPGLAYHAHTLELGNGSTGTARHDDAKCYPEHTSCKQLAVFIDLSEIHITIDAGESFRSQSALYLTPILDMLIT
ncbi:hypothetical protein M422DRAFT_775956, partial [Sphaerobolus stellatus SS14]